MTEQVTERVVVRQLRQEDFDDVVRIDRQHHGEERANYFARRFTLALENGEQVVISRVAELGGEVAGFIMGELSLGEFGIPESTASVESIGVDVRFERRGVGRALLAEFVRTARVAGVEKLYTRVRWNNLQLIRFFDSAGFVPGQMINLELNLG
jgi:ribosomal protein S18 acetylase RimI-like enzyme